MTNQQGAPEALYASAMEFAAEKASISYVQRKCRCSWNDAEQMLERMVREGIIATYNGRKSAALVEAQLPDPSAGAEHAETMRRIGEGQAFEAWFKVDCPVEGVNARIAAKAAWQARAALAAPHPSPQEGMVGGWRPMADAPRDGTLILAAIYIHSSDGTAEWQRHAIYFDDERDCTYLDGGDDTGWEFDDYEFWTPLPPPPTSSADSRKGE